MVVSVQIDEDLSEEISRLAESGKRTPNEIVREAVQHYVRCLDLREDFEREVDASWEAYQKDGLHLTGAEVSAWLRTVGTDDEATEPECHT